MHFHVYKFKETLCILNISYSNDTLFVPISMRLELRRKDTLPDYILTLHLVHDLQLEFGL